MSSSLLSLPFAGFLGLVGAELLVILMIMAFPVFVVAIVATALFFKHRQRQLWHETARLALERGQPLPPLPTDISRHEARGEFKRQDLRAGIILVAVGLGIYEFFNAVAPQARNLGAIPGFIGGALILLAIIEAMANRKKAAAETRPPQT